MLCALHCKIAVLLHLISAGQPRCQPPSVALSWPPACCMPAGHMLQVHQQICSFVPCTKSSNALQGEGVDAEEEISFVYRKQRFVYNEDAHCFKKLEFPVEVCGCQLRFCFHNSNAEDSSSR